MTKRINKILWHGTEVPQASSKADGLDGLNEGELFIKNDPEEPGIFIRTTDAKVVKVGDSGIKLLNRLFTAFDANGNQVAFDDFSTTIASIRANYGLWTEYFLSAKGRNPNTGSSSGGDGASTLGGLNNVADGADVGEEGYDVAKMLVLEAKSNLWTLKNLSELVGLDADALLAYLTENNYAKKSDIPSLDGYATESWVLGKGYATTTDLDARIDALVNGAPAAYDTLKEIADVLGKNVDSIADILDALGTKANKVDVDAAISAVNASISALNTELSGKIDLKLDAATFNELFEKVQLSDGTWAIRAKLGLYTDYFLSAKGANSSGGSSTGGAGALYQLADVLADGQQVSGAATGALLMYNGTQWQGVSQSEIVPNLTGYAKLTDIPTTFAWDKVTGKPATLSGYGITDAYTSSQIDTKLGGYQPLATAINTGNIGSYALKFYPYDWTSNVYDVNIVAQNQITTHDKWTNAPYSSIASLLDLSYSKDWRTQIFFCHANQKTYLRYRHNGTTWLDWKEIAFTDSNVASATKLQTARTIWGQSFDGTKNIEYSAIPTMQYINFRSYVDETNVITLGRSSSANNDLYLITRYSNNIRFETYNAERMRIAADGNVGIGTTSPQYKLDVVGDARVSRLVIGDGVIEWDSENKGFKIVGGLYTETYLSSKGANPNGGSSSSGGQYTRLDEWTNYSSAYDTWVLSAKLGKGLYDTQNSLLTRVGALEGKATNVSFTQSLTSGTQIGTITIDGASKTIYAPTIPTSLKNPNALTFGTKTYDGSAAKTILASDLGALTAHQTIYALTIKNSAGTTQLTYTPNSAVGSLTLTKAMVGLGNVENTALSTWVGTNKITTLGTITSGTWNGTKIANSYLANSAITIAGTSVSLGSSITAATLQSNLGLGALAYKGSLSFSELTNKPTTISGYGITDAVNMPFTNTYYYDLNTLLSNNAVIVPYFQRVGVTSDVNNIGSARKGVIRLNGGGSESQLLFDHYSGVIYHRNYRESAFTDWRTILHSENYTDYTYSKSTIDTKLGGYLPLSGGTLSAWGNPLTIERTDGASPAIGFLGVSGAIGAIGVDYNNEPYFYRSSNTTSYFLIHSGNIGSYALKFYPYDWTSNVYDVNIVAQNQITTHDKWTNAPYSSIASLLDLSYSKDWRTQIFFCHANQKTYLRYRHNGTTWLDWKEIAFTDSNVASAAKLTTARTIWGQSFNGENDVNGHLSIGTIMGQVTANRAELSIVSETDVPCDLWLGNSAGNVWSINCRASNENRSFSIYHGSLGHLFRIDGASGNVGIGTTSPQYKLDVSGVIHSNTGIFSDGYVSAKGQNTSSDMRLKNVLNDVVLGVKDIANAPSVRFAWKNGGGVDVGSSAQYWQVLLPDAVKERNGMLEMQYANIALLSAIAIAKRVETHKERIERLEREVKELRIENVELKNKIGGRYAE